MDKEFAELNIINKKPKNSISKKIIKSNQYYSIVVGTFNYKNNAEKQLKLIKRKYPKTTNNKIAKIVLIKVGNKKLYESRFENFSKKDAFQACKRLKKYKRDCFIRS